MSVILASTTLNSPRAAALSETSSRTSRNRFMTVLLEAKAIELVSRAQRNTNVGAADPGPPKIRCPLAVPAQRCTAPHARLSLIDIVCIVCACCALYCVRDTRRLAIDRAFHAAEN